MPTEAEILSTMRDLGLDRVQAYRHLKQREAIARERKSPMRAALTACARPAGTGNLDSPPDLPPAFRHRGAIA